jgi:tetratricopeptide (TPR) repeat protein
MDDTAQILARIVDTAAFLANARRACYSPPTMTRTEPLATDAGGRVPTGILDRLDWSAFWVAAAIAFGVYSYTAAPTVTLEDSGELAVAGDYMGVPHPPGYPSWSFLAWIFARLFSFVTFRGQPDPAWAIAQMSAFFGGLAAGLTAMLICRSGRDILRESHHSPGTGEHATEDRFCWVAGVAASLLFAFSPCMWSQAVIVEVYSLNAFFLMLIMLLLYLWMRRPSDHLLWIFSFLFGLGLTNYQALLLFVLALGVAILLRDTELFRDFVILGVPYAAVFFLTGRGVIPPIRHPLDTTGFVYMFLNFVALALAYFFLPRGKTVAVAFLLAELGAAFYAYMPIVSDLRNPPMNWGYPRTWEGFKHAISRGQYEKIEPTDVFSMTFIHQIGTYLSDLRLQFTLPLAAVGFLPFATWQVRFRERDFRALYVAVPLIILAALSVLVEIVLLPGSAVPESIYKLAILGVLLIAGVGVVNVVAGQIEEFFRKAVGRAPASTSERLSSALVLLGGAGGYGYYALMLGRHIVQITEPLRKGGQIPPEQIQSILLGSLGAVAMMILPALLIGLVVWLMHSRFRLIATIEEVPQKWVIVTILSFTCMGLVFIALANLKMDIQDTFIQRVKFISSHGLYSLWIGYGILLTLAFLDRVCRGRRPVRAGMLGLVAALPLIPLAQNATDDELLRVYGGSEMNRHDFGWQFGNYQLRGADAISEELSPNEEPLPCPSFPPEMGPNAIFFGGTDPGRFVPTYMIYSARVREDVYLITQNALADNTYMSVMRDLYGDQIWIPAQPDSTRAFQRYVEEVQSGKRPKNAELKIEDGRVQVSGALGVMEINGILAQMIFEYNNYKHDFYVEESYVIPWMFPYLTPHGLIMKINRETTALSPEVVRDDQDFWDWYSRRLHDDGMFRRDVCARKSFSKLRSAIGGLYRSRGMFDEAENAFQQARILYPLSPEATFRLAQEVLITRGRFEEARDLMAEFYRQDPANSKAGEFIGQIDGMERTRKRITDLETEMRGGKLDMTKALELAELYQQMGQTPMFLQVIMGIVNSSNLPPMYHFRAAQLLNQARRNDEMVQALNLCMDRIPPDAPPEAYLDMARMYGSAQKGDKALAALEQYVRRRPEDWSGWMNVASIQIQMGKTDEAARALEQAARVGGDAAMQVIRGDQRFSAVYDAALSRARSLIGIPGLTPPPPPR